MTEVRPTTPVLLLTQTGEETTIQDALIVGILHLDPFTGADGEPSLDLVTVNPDELQHAGNSDWQCIMERHINVVHHSNPLFASRKVNKAYKFTNEPEGVSYTSFTQGDFSGDGDPYGIQAEYTGEAFQQKKSEPAEEAPAA